MDVTGKKRTNVEFIYPIILTACRIIPATWLFVATSYRLNAVLLPGGGSGLALYGSYNPYYRRKEDRKPTLFTSLPVYTENDSYRKGLNSDNILLNTLRINQYDY